MWGYKVLGVRGWDSGFGEGSGAGVGGKSGGGGAGNGLGTSPSGSSSPPVAPEDFRGTAAGTSHGAGAGTASSGTGAGTSPGRQAPSPAPAPARALASAHRRGPGTAPLGHKGWQRAGLRCCGPEVHERPGPRDREFPARRAGLWASVDGIRVQPSAFAASLGWRPGFDSRVRTRRTSKAAANATTQRQGRKRRRRRRGPRQGRMGPGRTCPVKVASTTNTVNADTGRGHRRMRSDGENRVRTQDRFPANTTTTGTGKALAPAPAPAPHHTYPVPRRGHKGERCASLKRSGPEVQGRPRPRCGEPPVHRAGPLGQRRRLRRVWELGPPPGYPGSTPGCGRVEARTQRRRRPRNDEYDCKEGG